MKFRSMFQGSIVSVVASLLVAATLRAGEMPKSILAENMELDARFVQAINDKDVDGVMACFANTPDVQVVSFGTVLRGPTAIRQHFQAMLAFPGTISGGPTEIRYTRVDDMVIAVGTAVVTFTPTVGTPFTITEVWSDVRKKIGGRWVYLIDHATLVVP